MKMFSSLWLCGVLLAAGTCTAGPLAAGVQGVGFAEYNPKDLSPLFQFHADRVFITYERRGFFRIGLLPELVAQHVRLQIHSTAALTNVLADLGTRQEPEPALRRVELRDLEIFLTGDRRARLRATTARFGRHGALELSEAWVRDAAGKTWVIPKAKFQVAGPAAGRLRWNAEGHQQSLFILNPADSSLPNSNLTP